VPNYQMNTLDPADPMDVIADAYDASDRIVADAIDHLSVTGESLPDDLINAIREWYGTTDHYWMTVEDIADGEVTL